MRGLADPIAPGNLVKIPVFFVFCLTLIAAGCGGGASSSSGGSSSGGGGGTQAATVTSVTPTCSPATILAGQTSTCTATVQGTGSYSSSVTWSVSPSSAGSISSAGVFAASASIDTATTATITANSMQAGYTTVSGSATVTINPPPPTVSVGASPSTITLGQSTTLTWSSTNATACAASGAWSGTQATSGTATETPATTGTETYTLSCTGPGGSASNAATVTVNAVPPPTVTIGASPSTITLGQSTTLTWSSTNATACTASGAWSGSVATSGSKAETPATTGTATYTLSCTGSGGSASKSASVTVNAAPLPNIASIVPDTIYLADSAIVGNVMLNGTNFTSGDVLYTPNSYNLYSTSLVSSNQISIALDFGSNNFSPGWLTFEVCQNSNDTGCGTAQSIAFVGGQQYLVQAPAGELFFLDQTQNASVNGFVRKYQSNGTADGSCQVGTLKHSIAVDNVTPYMLVDGQIYNFTGPNDPSGYCDYVDVPGPNISQSTQLAIMAVAARNGYAGLVEPANNSALFYDMTGGTGSQPTVYTASNLGTDPAAIAMGTYGAETDAFIATADGTPSLYKIRASDAYQEGAPLPLPGITPISTIQKTAVAQGGIYVVAFDSGPASGTVAVLSSYDKVIDLVDESTWTVKASIHLDKDAQGNAIAGMPFRIAADTATGTVIVAYANPVSVTTTYASVDASAGTAPMPLTTTSSLLSVGLVVSADGTTLYSGQRDQLQVLQNQ